MNITAAKRTGGRKPVESKRVLKRAGSSVGVVSNQIHHFNSTSAQSSPASLIKIIGFGLPVQELDALQSSLDVPIDRLAAKLGISTATLHRRKAQGRLDPEESDRVLRFARLMGKAVAVFGNLEDARQWLNSPQFGLGGTAPLDYAKTEIGAREVENLLGRIEYGVYS
jgi:putative toxin-antitoxin system antitoxin component (TIGR02293 family)